MRPSAMPMSVSSRDGRSASRALRMMRSIAFLLAARFEIDVRGFYDRPPFLDLGFMVGAKRFCGLPVRWRDHLTQVLEPVAHVAVGECVHGGFCECADNILRRTFGHP